MEILCWTQCVLVFLIITLSSCAHQRSLWWQITRQIDFDRQLVRRWRKWMKVNCFLWSVLSSWIYIVCDLWERSHVCSFIIEVSSREVQRLCPVLVSSAAATHWTCDTAGWLPVSACQDQNPTSSFLDGVFEKGVKEICYSVFAEHVKRGRRGSQDEDSSFEDGSGGGESPLQRAISPRGPPPHQMDHIHPRLSRAHGDSKYSALLANHF